MSEPFKRALIGALLVGCGYGLGASAPVASAYTQDETRLLNKIATELSGIRRSLDTIGRKMR